PAQQPVELHAVVVHVHLVLAVDVFRQPIEDARSLRVAVGRVEPDVGRELVQFAANGVDRAENFRDREGQAALAGALGDVLLVPLLRDVVPLGGLVLAQEVLMTALDPAIPIQLVLVLSLLCLSRHVQFAMKVALPWVATPKDARSSRHGVSRRCSNCAITGRGAFWKSRAAQESASTISSCLPIGKRS